jgi:hypothetical protein
MSSFIPSQTAIGNGFSVAGLALVCISTYFFRNYSRVLDCVQLFYVFALVFAPTGGEFSLNLGWGSLSFIPSFLGSFCVTGDFICTNGYLLSAGASWVGATFLMLIIIKIISCKRTNTRFQSFYNFWKGILRWVMTPLVYVSTIQVITQVKLNKIMDVNFYASAGVCAFFVIMWFVELIGYKCVELEEENTWKKWCDFFSNFRVTSVVALAAVSTQSNSMAKYFIYGPIIIYDLVFLIRYKFLFKCFERFVFIIQEAVLITVYSLFLFNNQYIFTYNIDLFGLAIVIFFELIIFFPRLANACKNDEEQSDPEVNPEVDRKGSPRKSIEVGEPSYDNLRGSESPSPRRNNKGRK